MDDFRVLNNDEVLYVNSGRVLMSNPTFKVGEFLDALAQLISEREEDWSDDKEGWFNEGLDCEALRFGNQGWQRGRVRLRLEFCNDAQPLLPRADRRRPDRVKSREGVREDIYAQPDYSDDDYQNDFDAEY